MSEEAGTIIGWQTEKLVGLVIIVFLLTVGVLILTQAGKTRGFEKTFTMKDLKFLKHSMLILGDKGNVVMKYNGITGSDTKIIVDEEKISVADTVELTFGEETIEWITKNAYFTYLVDDKEIESETVEISPIGDIVEEKRVQKYTPIFYIGLRNGNFIVKPPFEE